MSQMPEIDEVILEKCKDKNNELHMIQKSQIKGFKYENDSEVFDYKQYRNVQLNLRGKKQIENAAITLECCEILKENGFDLDEDIILKGLKTVIHPGRFEKIYEKPTIIFDGGHNEQAIDNLKETIDIYYQKEKKIYVISILKKKDYKRVLDQILDDDNIYIFTSGNDGKLYADNNVLYEYAKQKVKNNEIYKMELDDAIGFCKEKLDCVSFIIGSFYVYGDVVDLLKV